MRITIIPIVIPFIFINKTKINFKYITNELKANYLNMVMGFVSTKTLFMMEDRVMQTRGLYLMSFCCYV